MRRLFALTGIALVLLPALPAHAAPQALYSEMRDITAKELLRDTEGNTQIEKKVKEFTVRVRTTDDVPVTGEDVVKAFDPAQYTSLCAESDTRDVIPAGKCAGEFAPSLKGTAAREARIRALGRDLQLLATSYEAPVNDAEYAKFPAQAQSIIRIWRAGTGTGALKYTQSGLVLRVIPLTKDDTEDIFQNLTSALESHKQSEDDQDEYTAAIWRYHYGYRLVRDERPEIRAPEVLDAEPGTERQYLKKRYDDVEEALAQFWDLVQSKPVDPPLKAGEVVLFTLDDESKANLPDNVSVWAYREITREEEDTGDAGLQWELALEPVLPSLCREGTGLNEDCDVGDPSVGGDSTLGGKFPPPPLDLTSKTSGLCSLPYQRMGYLCRPFVANDPVQCQQEVEPDPEKIILAACTAKPPVTRGTIAGPDACEDFTWRKEEVPFDPNTQCTAELKCEDGPFSGGLTKPKTDEGKIEVTVKEHPTGGTAYLMIHELTHARQMCDLPVGAWLPFYDSGSEDDPPDVKEQRNQQCCTMEGEAYRNECEAMAQDGLFGPELEVIGDSSGLPINVETCTQILTDYSCRERGFGSCPTTVFYSKEGDLPNDQLQSAVSRGLNDIIAIGDSGPESATMGCSEMLDPKHPERLDPRVGGALRDLNYMGTASCDPGRMNEYDNTIGNNLCVFNQCVEQSLEKHHLIPGRMGLTVGDQAYPNDCQPGRTDPGSLELISRDDRLALPPYRPQLLIQKMDTALCQLNGLPAGTPPVICGAKPQRIGELPSQGLLELGARIRDQGFDLAMPTTGLENLSEALGVRLGSELYNEELTRSTERLSRITQNAVLLLQDFTTVQFSPLQCPYNNAEGWLYEHPQDKDGRKSLFCGPSSSSSSS